MGRQPTVEDVATAAGVSRQTVSNVLNAPDVVRPETRSRVEAAIARLGYRPHASARRLRTRRASTIGVRLDAYRDGIAGSILDRYVHALTERASERGLRVLLYAARTPEAEFEQLRILSEGADVDAFVLTGTSHDDERIDWLTERALPFVSFGRPWGADLEDPSHRWVDVDGAAGVEAATAHAIAIAGPRVLLLGVPSPSGTGDDRALGWERAMAAHGAGTSGLRLALEDSVTVARHAAAAFIQEDRIDAVVCVSDSMALGAHLAAVESGRGDLPVVGFDNTPVAEAVGFSSVEQRPEDIAAATIGLLLPAVGERDGEDEPPSHHVLIEPRLVVRG